MIDYRNLSVIPFSQILTCFNLAFSNYAIPFQLSEAQLSYMHKRRGIDYELSFGAFDDEQLIGFIFNCTGTWNGQSTAYDTGTGIIPEYQGKGLGKGLLEYTISKIREAGINQYILEVLCSNKPAYELYRKYGFQVIRILNCYNYTKNEILDRNIPELSTKYKVKYPKTINDRLLSYSWDYESSWQNSYESINRVKDDIDLVEIYDVDTAIAFGYIEKHTGDIPHIGVHPQYRRQGIGSNILRTLALMSDSYMLKYINVPEHHDELIHLFKSFNISLSLKQYEMQLSL